MKRWALSVLVASLLVLGICASVVYAIDPLEIYRQATWYTPIIDYNTQVYSNAGIARSYDYDSAIVGTSMMENAHPTLCDELFGGKWIKLVSSSGTAYNHAILLRTALREHELRRVIYGLDMFSFMYNPGAVAQASFPYYLYDENPFNDVYYLLNWDVLVERISEVYRYNRELRGAPASEEDARDAMYAWQLGKDAYNHRNALAQIDFNAPVREMEPAQSRAQNVYANLRANVLPFIQSMPETEFIFYFPPYCVLEWYSMYQRGYLEFMFWIKQALTEALLSYENVQIYDYQACGEWVLNLDLYMDRQHHGPETNDAIMRRIAGGEGRVYGLEDIAQAETALREWTDQIVQYGPQAPILAPYTQSGEDDKA